MGKIYLKFGYPTSIEEQDLLSERAVEKDCSVERALLLEFQWLAEGLIKRKGEENFFDLIFFVVSKMKVFGPKISCGTYIQNGYKMPMLVLENDYLISVNNSDRILITNEMLDELGLIYQIEFDYEYAGFGRA